MYTLDLWPVYIFSNVYDRSRWLIEHCRWTSKLIASKIPVNPGSGSIQSFVLGAVMLLTGLDGKIDGIPRFNSAGWSVRQFWLPTTTQITTNPMNHSHPFNHNDHCYLSFRATKKLNPTLLYNCLYPVVSMNEHEFQKIASGYLFCCFYCLDQKQIYTMLSWVDQLTPRWQSESSTADGWGSK